MLSHSFSWYSLSRPEYGKNYFLLTQASLNRSVKSVGGAQFPGTGHMRMTSKKIGRRYQRHTQGNSMCLKFFFSPRNIRLYRELADKNTDVAKRRQILELLAKSNREILRTKLSDEIIGTR